MKKIRVLLLLAMMLVGTGLQAQVPQEVSKILAACSKKMANPSGVEFDMKVSAGVAIAKMNMNMKMFTKGEKMVSHDADFAYPPSTRAGVVVATAWPNQRC